MKKPWPLSILLIAVSVFGHSSVQAFDAPLELREPASESCVIYAPNQDSNRDKNWQALGYQVKALPKALNQMTSADFANLLAKGEFALREDKKEIWFSLGKVGVVENWKPLSVRAPEKGSAPTASYSCKNMKAQMAFFKEGRKAIQETYALLQGKPTDRKIGDTLIDLERVFFLHKGVTRFDFNELHKRYANLLSATKKLGANTMLDFFEQWTEVRRLVFGKEKFNIAYCRDKTSIAEALLEQCTNCVGETFLLYALFKDAGFQGPPGWELGLQSFSDHLRLVIYDKKNQKVHDLATGKFDVFRAAIYPADSLPLTLLAGHSALKLDTEKSWIQSQSPIALYKAWSCKLPGVELRPALRPSDLSMYSSCDRYSPDSPPETASNESKTEVPSETKANPSTSSSTGNPGPPSNSSSPSWRDLGSMISSGWDGFSGFFSVDPRWFEYLIPSGPDGSRDSSKNFLQLYAEGLNPEEKKILLEGLEKKTADQTIISHFSQGSLLTHLGYSYYGSRKEFTAVEDDPYLAWHWNSPLLPLHIYEKGTPLNSMGTGVIRALSPEDYDENGNLIATNTGTEFFCDTYGRDCKMKIHFCHDIKGTCLQIKDPGLFAQMTSLSAVERMAKLLGLFKESFARTSNLEYTKVPDLIREAPARLRKAQLSSLTQDLIAFLHLYKTQTLLSDWGIMNRDDRGLGPIRDALLRSVGIDNFARIYDYHAGFTKAVSEATVTSLKEMDKLSKTDKEALKYHFTLLRGLIYSLNNFRQAPAFDLLILNRASKSDVDIQQALLAMTLHHPEYYFTVAPDADERVPGRPYSPWQIQDPRVQDMKKSVNQNRLPKVNLPIVAGVGHCAPGEKGYKAVNGFYILCGAEGQDSNDKTYESRWNQNGVVSNPKGGEVIRDIHGQDDRLVESGVRKSQYGFEAQGNREFHREMKDSERKLPVVRHYTEVLPDGNASADSGLLDPRQEVHLQPETWAVFVTPSSTEYIGPTDRVLLHHAYRKKLFNVFGFPKLVMWQDYEDNIISLPKNALAPLLFEYENASCDNACKDIVLDEFWSKTNPDSKAQLKPEFVSVAEQELQNPKSGWIVSTTAEAEISDEDLVTAFGRIYENRRREFGADWSKVSPTKTIPRGIRLPVVAKDGGIEYPVQMAKSPYLLARANRNQMLKQLMVGYVMSGTVDTMGYVGSSEESAGYDSAIASDSYAYNFKWIGKMAGSPYTRQNIHKIFDGLMNRERRPSYRLRGTGSNPKLREPKIQLDNLVPDEW